MTFPQLDGFNPEITWRSLIRGTDITTRNGDRELAVRRDQQHGFYAEASGTPSHFVNAGWPWYNFT